jgi:hypothetical protein
VEEDGAAISDDAQRQADGWSAMEDLPNRAVQIEVRELGERRA